MSFPSRRNVFVPVEFGTAEQRDLYDFMYEATLDRETPSGTGLWGVAMQIAGEHPDWTYWRVVGAVRDWVLAQP